MSPSYKYLLLSEKNQIAYVTLNRPAALNAISPELAEELIDFCGYLEHNPELRTAIITGAGSKAFAAGADLSSLGEMSALDNFVYRPFVEAANRFEDCSKPVIAAINGYALGGGFELALGCDLRIASENAKMGFPETGLAIIPGAGGTARLARSVGLSLAKELILTGRRMSAQEALHHGLVMQVVPPDELLDAATKVAEQLIEKGPIALSFAKKGIKASTEVDTKNAVIIEGLMAGLIFATEDRAEGSKAFAEHRKAVYHGR